MGINWMSIASISTETNKHNIHFQRNLKWNLKNTNWDQLITILIIFNWNSRRKTKNNWYIPQRENEAYDEHRIGRCRERLGKHHGAIEGDQDLCGRVEERTRTEPIEDSVRVRVLQRSIGTNLNSRIWKP